MTNDRYDWDTPKQTDGSFMDKGAGALQGAKKTAKETLRGSVNVICLISIIALEVLHRFVTCGFNKEFAINYVFSALITSMTSLLAFYVFFPNGKHAGRIRASFEQAATELKAARDALRLNGRIAAFRAWCRDRSEKEVNEIISARLETLENMYVSKADFETYRLYSGKKLRELVRTGVITPQAKRQIGVCKRAVRRKPYSPAYFLADVQQGKENVYLRGKDHYEARTLMMRPMFCVGIAVVTSIITWSPNEMGSVLSVLFSLAISIFQICLASVSGYSSGLTAASKEELAMRAKAGFLEEFNEAREKMTAAE